uniref:Uncharacterized protein n=1 Tax=Aegilops tauschii subsp. strangulata TaxID=200361 RepID=A0A453F1M6_AEGTS
MICLQHPSHSRCSQPSPLWLTATSLRAWPLQQPSRQAMLWYARHEPYALGSEFDDYTYLPAQGTRGGILLAWKSSTVTITAPLLTMNALTAKVTTATGAPWWLSVVYGPQEDADKIAFMQELRDVRASCP